MSQIDTACTEFRIYCLECVPRLLLEAGEVEVVLPSIETTCWSLDIRRCLNYREPTEGTGRFDSSDQKMLAHRPEIASQGPAQLLAPTRLCLSPHESLSCASESVATASVNHSFESHSYVTGLAIARCSSRLGGIIAGCRLRRLWISVLCLLLFLSSFLMFPFISPGKRDSEPTRMSDIRVPSGNTGIV